MPGLFRVEEEIKIKVPMMIEPKAELVMTVWSSEELKIIVRVRKK